MASGRFKDLQKSVADGSTRPFADHDIAALWDSAKPEHRHSFVKQHGFHDVTAAEASKATWADLQPAVKQAVGPAMHKTAVARYGADAPRTFKEAFAGSLRAAGNDVVSLVRELKPRDSRGFRKALHPGEPQPNTETHPDYRYHATNLENAHAIAHTGLNPHRPWHGTDQNAWPDGGTERRSYFTAKAHVAWHFSPEQGKAVLLRTHKDHAKFQEERSTGDFFVREPISPNKLEIMDHAGAWHPLQHLGNEKHDVKLGEGEPMEKSTSAPFQPHAPHPQKPRAPRRPTAYDPIVGHNVFAAPFKFKPHRLGDLWLLHQQDKYDTQRLKKVGMGGPVEADRENVKAPSLPTLPKE